MTYAYARVSSKEQKLNRQIDEFLKMKIDRIYSEIQSGKDFESRKIYQALKMKLQSGDTLVIASLDRLGRNYEQILKEWQYLNNKNVDIQVLDMPILNTKSQVDGLDGKFISQLVLQILAYVSQKEREKIKDRQRQGIEAAKKRGVEFGRPCIDYPVNIDEIIAKYRSHEITNKQAAEMTGVSRATFFRMLKEHENGE